MLAVILILYVGTTVFAPRATGAGATLTPSCTLSVEWERYLWQDAFFSQDQRVFILEHYFSTQSYAECQNTFRNSFPYSVEPNKSTVERLVDRFRETGSIGEKRRSGRPSVLSNDSLEDIRALTSVSKKIIKKTFPTNWNDIWVRTKGYKTSPTAYIPSPFTPWVAWLLDDSVQTGLNDVFYGGISYT
jgi:transposase